MAIKAHLDQSPLPADNQRSAPRRALWLETSGVFAGAGEANVTVHNISAAGLLLETGLVLAEGEQLALDLPEAGAVVATVAWRSERLYGCAFARPLGAAALAAAQLQGFAPGVPGTLERPAPALPSTISGPGEGLGARLNRLRREAGLTLADVAGALGVSKPTVWAWEKGKARPLPERLDAIAAALGVSSETLASAPPAREIDAVIAECRSRIAAACGTDPQAVRIMVGL
ncbi:MAG: helix-turn-helix domain-containing protein [Porphyrobacter sp.]|nr:helix-turn-helix domain-containing protein [Porphyrobacter sp.]